VVFDKTGTLTEGRPKVVQVGVVASPGIGGDPPDSETALLQDAAALQAGSEHPLARAVVQEAQARGLAPPAAREVHAVAGRGLEGRLAGPGERRLRIASTRWAEELGIDTAAGAAAQAQGHSVSWLLEASGAMADGAGAPTGSASKVPASGETAAWHARGWIAFGDEPKAGAAEAVRALRAAGLRIVLLSGDNRGAAEAVARRLGIDDVRAEVLPADKAAVINELRQHGRVAMVGDGINDAPALAAADVGLAMSTGTDVAMETAGLTLMRGDPGLVLEALQLSRAITRKIHQNLFWAFAYNVVGIPLAALGWLSPVVAGGAMALSSVSVLGNALLLARWKPH
jgi:Cu+-exporting ATPase